MNSQEYFFKNECEIGGVLCRVGILTSGGELSKHLMQQCVV